jgi:hypothetical protein
MKMRQMNALVAAGAVVALGVGGCAKNEGPERDTSPQSLYVPAQEAADCLDLVKEHGLPLLDGQKAPTVKVGGEELVVFRVGAAEDGTHRLYQDGTNTPLADRTPAGVQASMCEDPGQAAQFLAVISDKRAKIGDTTPGEVNDSWIQLYFPLGSFKINHQSYS